jgi:hypothetical protein
MAKLDAYRMGQESVRRAAAVAAEQTRLAPFREAGLVVDQTDPRWGNWTHAAKRNIWRVVTAASGQRLEVRPELVRLSDGSQVIKLSPTSLEDLSRVMPKRQEQGNVFNGLGRVTTGR